MDEKSKKYLDWSKIVLMAALALSALWYVRTYSRSVEPSTFRSFTVTGEGKAVAIPDMAEFSFSVLTQGGKNLGALQQENTVKVNRAIGVAKAAGVEDKDIKTTEYTVEPRYQYFNCSPGLLDSGKPCPPPEIVGYTVRQTVAVKVRDFSKIGDLLRDVVESGANTVSQLNFTLDDPTETQNQARAEAIQKAKAKSKSIAKAGGFRIGRLLSIEEGGGPVPIFYKTLSTEAFGRGGDFPAPAPAIEPGSQETQVTVILRYEIR